MSENEKAHDEVRIKPSIESLRLAVELANGTRHAWTAECIVRSAALFDAYLSGSLAISMGIDDCTSDFNRANGLINGLNSRFEIVKNIPLINKGTAGVLPSSIKQSLEQLVNKTFSGHSAHHSSPSSVTTAPDSYSTGHTEIVAISAEQQAELKEQDSHDWMEAFVIPFIKQLSGADLAAINAGVIPTPLMKLLSRVAYNEIERRRDA